MTGITPHFRRHKARAADTASANDRHRRGEQTPLPAAAHFLEHDVAGVAVELCVTENG